MFKDKTEFSLVVRFKELFKSMRYSSEDGNLAHKSNKKSINYGR